MDAIAKTVGASRATIYQYFESKEDIFLELFRQCEPAVLQHGQRLSQLGPNADGVQNLHQWLLEWAQLYDKYAVVFLEFPGIGTIESVPRTDAGAVSDQYADLITSKLRAGGVTGIDPADAAAALLRISHMVNLYRFRGMFGLRSSAQTSASLTIAMQLLLFPQTPVDAIAALATSAPAGHTAQPVPGGTERQVSDEPEPLAVSPIRRDVLSAGSALFAERGYYSVAMEDIAATANISRATLYRHFSTKVKILAELTDCTAREGGHLATELSQLAERTADDDALHNWMARYVRFHRNYRGVIRSWYDGTLAQQLAEEAVTQGIGDFHDAANALLDRFELPIGMDPAVAVAVFLAVLGRMTEMSVSLDREDSDPDIAALMMLVLKRALFGLSVEELLTPGG